MMQTTYPTSMVTLLPVASVFNTSISPKPRASNNAPTLSDLQNLSPEKLRGRERRRLRNLRREEALKSRIPLEEVLKKKENEKLEMSKLTMWEKVERLGHRWWTLIVSANRVTTVRNNLPIEFRKRFPDIPFQVFVAEVPAKKKLKNGSYSKAKRKLFPGFVFVQCSLNKEIHDFIKGFPHVRGFEGRELGTPMISNIEPIPVGPLHMEQLMKKVREAQEAFEREILESKERMKMQAYLEDSENTDVDDMESPSVPANVPRPAPRRTRKSAAVRSKSRADRGRLVSISYGRVSNIAIAKGPKQKKRGDYTVSPGEQNTVPNESKGPKENSGPFSDLINVIQRRGEATNKELPVSRSRD